MKEVIKYFESLEARIAEYEKRIAALEEAQQTNEAVIASMEAEIEARKRKNEEMLDMMRQQEEERKQREEEEVLFIAFYV